MKHEVKKKGAKRRVARDSRSRSEKVSAVFSRISRSLMKVCALGEVMRYRKSDTTAVNIN